MSAGTVLFRQWLKQRRRDLDLTQEDLALCVDCSLSTIEKLESGERRPSKQVVELLAVCLKVPVNERQAFARFARAEPGRESLAPLELEPAERAPWRAAHFRHTNLPVPLTPLIGRTEQAAAIQKELAKERTRLLTLTGPPGVGKTRLCIDAASEAAGMFEDGVFFVALAPISDPGLVLPEIARALKVKEVAGSSPAERLKECLSGKRALLVLDNFEHVVGAAAHVADILSYSPWLKVLATSRQPLRVRGERLFPVPTLDVPDLEQDHGVDALLTCASVVLFVDRALEANPGLQIDEESARAIAAICARLEGLPLAIELVAARSDMLAPAPLLQSLRSGLELTSPLQDVPARHQTLRAAVSWSYRLLSRGEKLLFARLGVFVGGCTRSAIEAVCNPMGDLPRPVREELESLAGKSLLRVLSPRDEESTRGATPASSRIQLGDRGEPRYSMLETIHEYAAECLQESDDLATVHRLHAEYYLALAQAIEPELEGPQQAALMDLLESEHDNLSAALRWSLDSEQEELALQLSGSLGRFWNTRGYLSEGLRWLEESISMAAGRASQARAKALIAAGMLASRQGHYAQATAFYEEGLAIYRHTGSSEGIATAVARLGAVANEQGEYEQADELYRKSLALYRELGDQASIASVLNNIGNQELARGNHEQALSLYSESLRLAREIGSAQRAATALLNLGRVALYHREDYAEATLLLTESLSLNRALGNKGGMAAVLYQLGQVMVHEGHYSRAHDLFHESLRLCNQLEERPGIAASLLGLGLATLLQGGYRQARVLLEESLLLHREIGLRRGVIEALEALAGAATMDGEYARAAHLLAAGEALRELTDQADGQAAKWLVGPWIEQAKSQLDSATFDAEWEQGRNMSEDEAVAYVLGPTLFMADGKHKMPLH